MHHPKRILVIGGGVIGLSSALALAREGHEVAIWSRDLPSTTTSWVAGAFFYPVRLSVDERVTAWLADSYEHFSAIAQAFPQAGVMLRDAVEVLRGHPSPPTWLAAVGGSRPARPEELPVGQRQGVVFRCPVIDTRLYLEWLMQEIRRAKISWSLRAVSSLQDIRSEADIVVVATGLRTRELVADPDLIAVRGQIVVLAGSVTDRVILDEHHPQGTTYIVPRHDTCVLGSVAQPHDEDVATRPVDTQAILRRCTELLPALEGAKILEVRAGLRPFRPQVRLEVQPGSGSMPPLVYNYGHGGAGITLSWGCARNVAALVQSAALR